MLKKPMMRPRLVCHSTQSRGEGGCKGREQGCSTAAASDLLGQRDSHCRDHLQALNQEQRTGLSSGKGELNERRIGVIVVGGSLTSSEPGQFS